MLQIPVVIGIISSAGKQEPVWCCSVTTAPPLYIQLFSSLMEIPNMVLLPVPPFFFKLSLGLNYSAEVVGAFLHI